MLFEVIDETRNFTTTYKSDYIRRKLRKDLKAKPFFFEPKEDNLLFDPFKEHLNIQKKNDLLPPFMRTESLQDKLNALRSKHPHMKKLLSRGPPDEALVEREQKNLFKSTYKMEFCKLDDHREKKVAIEIKLPEDWPMPETIQKKSFRDPSYFGNVSDLKQGPIKNPDNLVVDEKERELLRIRTGDTEYQSIIGKVGRQIIKEQFYGPPMPWELPEKHKKGSDSARSYCSQILMNSKRPAISQIF